MSGVLNVRVFMKTTWMSISCLGQKQPEDGKSEDDYHAGLSETESSDDEAGIEKLVKLKFIKTSSLEPPRTPPTKIIIHF